MIVGSLTEDRNFEQRIAITLDIVKKYKNLGFDVVLPKGYGEHLGVTDKEFLEHGVDILNSNEEIILKADLILQHNILSQEDLNLMKDGQTLVGVLNPYINEEKLKFLGKKNINCFSLELLPRITRAQSMDILSSQANLAGYKAVVDSFSHFRKAVPMMMTAAGTITAARVLVVGAGVAGLQAIATAKRMGAVVFATDVRTASKEQVESLGGKFLTVEGSENLETSGGYAKETSDEFKKKQEELLKKNLEKIDIVICTALIPGKKAPIIIKKDMIEIMASIQDKNARPLLEETLHIDKVDSPSGTALAWEEWLGQEIKFIDYRSADTYGVHKLTVETENETISIEHIIKDRTAYAQGALDAAQGRSTCG
mgnify:CR=1 FL=1